MLPPSAAANSSAIFVFAAAPTSGAGARAGWGAGQKASVAPGPAASATISHFPARGGIRFLPKVAFPVHCQSRHCPPPVPTVPPARLLAVCDPDTTRLGSVINPLPARPTPIQPCRAADWEGGAVPRKSMRTVVARPLSGQTAPALLTRPPNTCFLAAASSSLVPFYLNMPSRTRCSPLLPTRLRAGVRGLLLTPLVLEHLLLARCRLTSSVPSRHLFLTLSPARASAGTWRGSPSSQAASNATQPPSCSRLSGRRPSGSHPTPPAASPRRPAPWVGVGSHPLPGAPAAGGTGPAPCSRGGFVFS